MAKKAKSSADTKKKKENTASESAMKKSKYPAPPKSGEWGD